MSQRFPSAPDLKIPRNSRLAIVAARFNTEIVDHLLADCVKQLEENSVAPSRLDVQRVPGSFELPVACKAFCQTGRYAAVIALGAIIRGETPHFELVAQQCASGLREVGLEFSVPVIFGVLATNDEKQAWARTRGPHSRGGIASADAACEMIATLNRIKKNHDQHGRRRTWPSVKHPKT